MIQSIISAISDTTAFAFAAVIAVCVGISAGIGMSIATSKAIDAIARQPESEGKIRTTLLLGLAFIETTAIYGLLIAILLVIKVL